VALAGREPVFLRAQPGQLDLGVAAGIGAIAEVAQPAPLAPGDALRDQRPVGAQRTAQAAHSDAEVVQRLGVLGTIEPGQGIGGLIEIGQRHESGSEGRGPVEQVGEAAEASQSPSARSWPG
jgi:hypothetical protein